MAGNHRSGRRPLPLEKLTGYQRRGREPQYDKLTTAPDPPAWLGEIGAAEWRRVVPQLIRDGAITWADLPALEGYCAAYDMAVSCERQIREEGRTVEDPIKKRKLAHPLVAVSRIAWREVRSFASEFGLTPATRPRLAPKMAEPEQEPDPLQAFAESRNEPSSLEEFTRSRDPRNYEAC